MSKQALTELRLQRRFDASPERLFEAWTAPQIAAGWLFTTPASQAHETKLDVRPGGRWVIVDRRGGALYRAIGEYLETDRPRRLVFTFGMPQLSPEFSRVTVEIEPDGVGARQTLTQDSVPAEHIPGLEQGWGEMLDQLAARLAAG